MKEVDVERIKLDPYEQEIEKAIEEGYFEPVENFEEWKKALEEAAERTLKKRELTLRFATLDLKRKALEILKEHLGESFKVVSG